MLLDREKSCNLRHSGLSETGDIRPHYSAAGPECSLYSQKRTLTERVEMSALCQKRASERVQPVRAMWRLAGRGRIIPAGLIFKAEHILDRIRDGRFAVPVAIFRNLLGVLYHCVGLDDHVVAFAVVVTA